MNMSLKIVGETSPTNYAIPSWKPNHQDYSSSWITELQFLQVNRRLDGISYNSRNWRNSIPKIQEKVCYYIVALRPETLNIANITLCSRKHCIYCSQFHGSKHLTFFIWRFSFEWLRESFGPEQRTTTAE